MTVADYFASHRDEHGRAWLSQHCWIEHGVGCFRLDTPTEELSLLGSDDVGVAVSIAAKVFPPLVDEANDEEVPVGGGVDVTSDGDTDGDSLVAEEGGPIDFGRDAVADHFDDFRGRGTWPGPGADDAESGDFEVDEDPKEHVDEDPEEH